jgi:hypothetical protein
MEGFCRQITRFFLDNFGEIVDLAFFDINAYNTAEDTFHRVWEHLSPGGVVALCRLTRDSMPAEGVVSAEKILNISPHILRRTSTYSVRALLFC